MVHREHAEQALEQQQGTLQAEQASLERAAKAGLTDDQAKIETSCLAEYVEREIARQHHTVPPDERDDHGG